MATAASKMKRATSLSTLAKSFRRTSAMPPVSELSANEWNAIHVLVDGKRAVIRYNAEILQVLRIVEAPTLQTAIHHVLYASSDKDQLIISTLAKKSGKLHLVKIEARPDAAAPEGGEGWDAWIKGLMKAAYPATEPRRNFLVLINPVGGQGKAPAIYDKRVRPVLEAAHCTLEVIHTTHHGHAQEIATTLPLVYDAVLAVSGDGIPYEVINGFAQRLDARAAYERTAVVPIPGGSANALSINILGVENGLDPVVATLNAIKGKPINLDLVSVTMMKTRETVYSFLSQAGGLMAELDIGTEHLRWMGSSRFIIGYLKGVINNTPRNMRVLIRKPETDKQKMLDEYLSEEPVQQPPVPPPTPKSPNGEAMQRMPTPVYIDEPEGDNEWIEFDKPILYIYGGLAPYVAADLLDFPMKQAGDGAIHLVVQEIEARGKMIRMIDGAEKGDPFFLGTHRYFKTQAYRIIPSPTTKERECLSIDGERIPYEPIHCEVHPGILKTYSPYGKFVMPLKFGKEGLKLKLPEPTK